MRARAPYLRPRPDGGAHAKVNQTKPALSSHFIGDDAPVTMPVIALEAEQARKTVLGGFNTARQIVLSNFRTQVSVENQPEIIEAPFASGYSTGFGVAQPLQVKIVDASRLECFSKTVLGKALLPRDRNVTNIDKQIDADVLQRRQEVLYRTTFIADGMQRLIWHIAPNLRVMLY